MSGPSGDSVIEFGLFETWARTVGLKGKHTREINHTVTIGP